VPDLGSARATLPGAARSSAGIVRYGQPLVPRAPRRSAGRVEAVRGSASQSYAERGRRWSSVALRCSDSPGGATRLGSGWRANRTACSASERKPLPSPARAHRDAPAAELEPALDRDPDPHRRERPLIRERDRGAGRAVGGGPARRRRPAEREVLALLEVARVGATLDQRRVEQPRVGLASRRAPPSAARSAARLGVVARAERARRRRARARSAPPRADRRRAAA
jgi:hypothetical protein